MTKNVPRRIERPDTAYKTINHADYQIRRGSVALKGLRLLGLQVRIGRHPRGRVGDVFLFVVHLAR